MTRLALRIAVAAVRAWTAVYTWRLPPELRGRRRAEIESDLWESQRAEPFDAWLALRVIERLLLGVPDDLHWRLEQATAAARVRRGIVMCLGVGTLMAVMWIGVTSIRAEPPHPPGAPELIWRRTRHPAPPPPPPPPCNPPGVGRPAFSPCTPYPR